MIIGVSGHRQFEGFGFGVIPPNVAEKTREIFLAEKPDKVLSGFALGFDLWVAQLCVEMGIPFDAILAFDEQAYHWRHEQIIIYHNLIKKANKVEIIGGKGFANHKYQLRDEWVVDNSDKMVIAYFGTPGGTKNTLDYAIKIKKETILIEKS